MSKDSSPRQLTRSRILDATERLLETTSSQGFKVADIAGEAGVSPSLVIQYFNTKDELVFEAALRRMNRLDPDVFNRFCDEDARLDLWSFFEYTLSRDLENAHLVADIMSLSWRWSAENEAQLFAALGPRRTALENLLRREVAGSLPVGALEALEIVYAGVLRQAIVHRWRAEAAFPELRAKVTLLLDGLRR